MHATTNRLAVFILYQRGTILSCLRLSIPFQCHYDASFDSTVPLINELEKYHVESPVRLGTSTGKERWIHRGSEHRTEARTYKGSVSGQTGRNEAARVLFVRLSTPFLPPFKPFPLSPPTSRTAPFCEPRIAPFITSSSPTPAPSAAPPYTVHLPWPYNNARVYTVCPYPPAYIFASYNIDYFGRISG